MVAKSRALTTRRTRVPKVYVNAFRRRSRKSKKISLAIIGGFAPLAMQVWAERNKEIGDGTYGLKGGLKMAVVRTTGFNLNNNTWKPAEALPTWGAIILGIMLHKFAGRYVNRYLKRIPWVEI